MPTEVQIRPARPEDAEAITAIFAQGIGERTATFRTVPPGPEHFAERIEEGRPYVVAEEDGRVVAWAGPGPTTTAASTAGSASSPCTSIPGRVGEAWHVPWSRPSTARPRRRASTS